MTLNSVRAPDASKDFTLKLNCASEMGELAAVAGKKAVTLDVVTVLKFRRYSHPGSSKEMFDGIFWRFPGLKLLRCGESSTSIYSMMICSFLDNYQVGYSTVLFITPGVLQMLTDLGVMHERNTYRFDSRGKSTHF